ncbi:hypothetical protein Sn110110_048 [Cyanophage S-RIM14]|uniref:Uncharacterized protein n=1 Tax=Cyanophage S-RIM14 TaxID=1278423 RepID=A0A1D7SL28_9CAUD|nr:hypothetical protein Sn110110_048 [Cyanophage S-RIM14]
MSQLNVGTVNATTITTGATGVQFDDGSSQATAAIGSMTLNDLNDLSAGTPGVNQQLTWNGSAWAPQTTQQNIVKVWANGGTTVDQVCSSRRGSSTSNMMFINGTEIDCGIPENASNWHRVYWSSVVDDSGGPSNPDGFGFGLFRNVNNGGWTRILDMGSHSNYVNGLGDWYEVGSFFAYVPVVNNTQNHKYRMYMDRHNDVNYRVNCGIGDDYKRNGWNNSCIEVWEISTTNFTTYNLTRY